MAIETVNTIQTQRGKRRSSGYGAPSLWVSLGALVAIIMGTTGAAADSKHEFASINALLAIGLIGIALAASYLIKKYKFYYLPESAATMLLGMVVGGIARAVVHDESELENLRFQVCPVPLTKHYDVLVSFSVVFSPSFTLEILGFFTFVQLYRRRKSSSSYSFRQSSLKLDTH